MSDFYFCFKNIPEAKFKCFILIALAGEISRQPSTDCVMWLLVITIHRSTVKRASGAKRNVKCTFEEKKSTKNCNAGAKACAQGDEKLKERPDSNWKVNLLLSAMPGRNTKTRLIVSEKRKTNRTK